MKLLTSAPSPWLGGAVKRFASLTAPLLLAVGLISPQTAFGADAPDLDSGEPTAEDADEKSKEQAAKADPGKEAAEKARKAEARHKSAKAAGHSTLAERLSALAKSWLQAAVAQRKAADLEAQADEVQRNTLELEAQARRASSLVEQTEARRARALARLQELGLAAESPSPSNSKESDASRKQESDK